MIHAWQPELLKVETWPADRNHDFKFMWNYEIMHYIYIYITETTLYQLEHLMDTHGHLKCPPVSPWVLSLFSGRGSDKMGVPVKPASTSFSASYSSRRKRCSWSAYLAFSDALTLCPGTSYTKQHIQLYLYLYIYIQIYHRYVPVPSIYGGEVGVSTAKLCVPEKTPAPYRNQRSFGDQELLQGATGVLSVRYMICLPQNCIIFGRCPPRASPHVNPLCGSLYLRKPKQHACCCLSFGLPMNTMEYPVSTYWSKQRAVEQACLCMSDGFWHSLSNFVLLFSASKDPKVPDLDWCHLTF